jgi:hypothetical protein
MARFVSGEVLWRQKVVCRLKKHVIICADGLPVIISNPALRDLGTIARFIAQGAYGSPAKAEMIGEQLIALLESLASLP